MVCAGHWVRPEIVIDCQATTAAPEGADLTSNEIELLIREHLDIHTLEVRSDDDVHFEALVVSPAFSDKRPVARHQMIYAALGDHMRADIHALSINALTPDEFSQD